MGRLAEYMADLAKLYGYNDSVHFVQLKKGSTCIESKVDLPDVPKVRARLKSLKTGEADQDLMNAYRVLDERLAADNAIGKLTGHSGNNVINFPGRDRIAPATYGPIVKEGDLDGILIDIGGKDKTVSLRIQLGDVTYTHIETDRATAKQMGHYLFEPIRITGRSKWIREEDGVWKLKHFKVREFTVLDKSNFQEVLEELRKVKGSGWSDFDDPLAELERIRGDDIH